MKMIIISAFLLAAWIGGLCVGRLTAGALAFVTAILTGAVVVVTALFEILGAS